MICPCCNKRVPRSHFACESGSRGGKAGKGAAKARTSEQARAAVKARWERVKREAARNALPSVRKGKTPTRTGRKSNARRIAVSPTEVDLQFADSLEEAASNARVAVKQLRFVFDACLNP